MSITLILSLLTVCLLLLLNSNYSAKATACDENDIRLVGGMRSFEGRVEVCHGDNMRKWKTVCNQGWGNVEARVVCRQLGFPEDNRTSTVQNANMVFNIDSSQPILRVQWKCVGDEQQILICPVDENVPRRQCNMNSLGGVHCFGSDPDNCSNGEVRLVNGDGFSGRVEICVDDFWGTVCDNGWDVNDATTVCKQLGLSERGVPTRRAYFGEGSGPIHFSRAQCRGRDTSLINCNIGRTGSEDGCGHDEDAGVICRGVNDCEDWSVRLVGGENEREGRVEVCYNGVWGTVCDNRWNKVNASVVCIQLGYDGQNAIPLHHLGAGEGPILLAARVKCNNNHTKLSQCVHPKDIGIHNCNRNNTAGVVCPIPSNESKVLTASASGVICPTTTIKLLSTLRINTSSFIATTLLLKEPSVTLTTTSKPTVATFGQLLTTVMFTPFSIIATTLLLKEPSVTTTSKPTVATSSQSQLALFGSVGAALAVGTVAIVALLLVLLVVVLIRRKKNKNVNIKEAIDNPVYDETINFGLPGVIDQDNNVTETDFPNPLYSDIGPSLANTTNNPTQNGTVEGQDYSENALITENQHYEVPCNSIPGAVNEMPPTLDSVNTDGDEDNCYSTLGPTDHDTTRQHSLQHQQPPPSVDDSDYSRLQHK